MIDHQLKRWTKAAVPGAWGLSGEPLAQLRALVESHGVEAVQAAFLTFELAPGKSSPRRVLDLVDHVLLEVLAPPDDFVLQLEERARARAADPDEPAEIPPATPQLREVVAGARPTDAERAAVLDGLAEVKRARAAGANVGSQPTEEVAQA